MTSARLPFSFSIDPDTPFDTLEMVLAIARRIGLRLLYLSVRDEQVMLELGAGGDDPLALFAARLHNVIGVHDIVLNVCILPISEKCRTLHPPTIHQTEKQPCT